MIRQYKENTEDMMTSPTHVAVAFLEALNNIRKNSKEDLTSIKEIFKRP